MLPSNRPPGKFIGISTFFNPGRHQNKVDNFRLFRASVKAQGLQMLCVELTFGDTSFQLRADDCDILLQRRTAVGIAPHTARSSPHLKPDPPHPHLVIPTLTGTLHPRPFPWLPPAAARELPVSCP